MMEWITWSNTEKDPVWHVYRPIDPFEMKGELGDKIGNPTIRYMSACTNSFVSGPLKEFGVGRPDSACELCARIVDPKQIKMF